MKFSVELAFRCNSVVGEGPLWDDVNQKLLWIDVLGKKVFIFDPETSKNAEYSIDKHVGSVALSASEKIFVAAQDEFLWLDPIDSSTSSVRKILNDERFRFNDGKVDARGRFVIGTMGYEPQLGTASVYSYSYPQSLETIINGVGLSNGMCWSQDNEFFFYIDTLTSEVSRFDYDIETGRVGNRFSFIKFEKNHGSPDGMTIDIEGNLWVGFWGGGCIRRVSSTGKILQEIRVPVSRVTSATFGGKSLNQLFITTASYQLSPEELQTEPLAGSLFVLDTDTQGLPENRINQLH